jgi:predicted acetyltransferase
MATLEIRQLGPDDEAAFLAGLDSWADEDPAWHTFTWTEGMTHDEHLRRLSDDFHGRNLKNDRVLHTMLYGFLEGVIVGRCSVRHELNDHLREWGGHIGYGVAPPFRKRGFGKQLFQAGREHLKSLGKDKAFLVCEKRNEASRKLIEGAGGVLQDEVIDPADQEVVLRFWVPLV